MREELKGLRWLLVRNYADLDARSAAAAARLASPIYFAALASDGLATSGSSETVTGYVQPLVKTYVTAGSPAIYLLPINVLFVDPNARVAHGIIDGLGYVSCRILNP